MENNRYSNIFNPWLNIPQRPPSYSIQSVHNHLLFTNIVGTYSTISLQSAFPMHHPHSVEQENKLFHTRRAHILYQCNRCWMENKHDPRRITYEGNKTCVTFKLCAKCRDANINICNQYYAAGFGRMLNPN